MFAMELVQEAGWQLKGRLTDHTWEASVALSTVRGVVWTVDLGPYFD